jgi:hypothetical protein
MAVTSIAPAEASVAVGDFFVRSWGYDQTNVDFYKVVGLTPKGVKVQKWTSACVGGEGGPSERVVPGEAPATYVDWSACTPEMDHWEREEAKVVKPVEVETKRLQTYDGGKSVYVSIDSYSSAGRWGGESRHQTGAYYQR